jgi:hypothetical protein
MIKSISYIQKKNQKTNVLVIQSNKPTNHMRIVIAGISGSSMLETEARTSGYGLSSSSMASKSNSILEGVGDVSTLVIGRESEVEDI